MNVPQPVSPSLKFVRSGLHRTTEALAAELAAARPGGATPDWTDVEWRLAMAAATAHGISPLLSRFSTWQNAPWRQFLEAQHEHVACRYQRIASMLKDIDTHAHAMGLAVVPLKGSALHALGLYAPGDRPMADIDLLVHEDHMDRAAAMLNELGYRESFAQWKHRTFAPTDCQPKAGLGEHRDTPVNIELHAHIQERLPISIVDITAKIYPLQPHPGINAYPSTGALMSHLLLHAAGNICARSLRLMHLNDISLLATRMAASDWHVLWEEESDANPWWALPPLRLVARYYKNAVPAALLTRLEHECPPVLSSVSRRQTLTRVSCSALWLQALPGIEWCRTLGEVGRYLVRRVRPTEEAVKERADMMRTQVWLQGQHWVRSSQRRRILTWLTQPVPRMDTLYVVRAALESPSV
ncbi:nucleotidyltransferase family protein [Dyella sp. 2HG41-7]|uniref:nucleotidyltransferase family protein n=1 Tax=Dyella sp. 2HG41-7 TaxID=2883239 RepID=UPI001F2A8D66|nr:nucleotidyltransferase family protein [Dyella sp. 2HG41-7]